MTGRKYRTEIVFDTNPHVWSSLLGCVCVGEPLFGLKEKQLVLEVPNFNTDASACCVCVCV